MSATPISYATDEDLVLRASADFSLLCPRDQKLASGTDGLFDASDRWTLMSPSVDFAAQGLAAGQVVQLLGPTTTFKPPGEALVVAAVGPNRVLLRRKGQSAGVGHPPAPAGGIMNVEFLAATLAPQIARASYDLDRRYGIDDLIDGRRPGDLYDPREVREAVVLTVLMKQYRDMSREGGSPARDDAFAAKARLVKQELDELLARVVVHWGAAPMGGPAATRFSSRLAR
jgi:hypothetical protein